MIFHVMMQVCSLKSGKLWVITFCSIQDLTIYSQASILMTEDYYEKQIYHRGIHFFFFYNEKIHLLQFSCKLKFGLRIKEKLLQQRILQKFPPIVPWVKNQQPRDNREMENKMKAIVNNWAGFSVFFFFFLAKVFT